MKSFRLDTGIQEFPDFAACAESYGLDEQDLILTNEYIYHPAISQLSLPCQTLFQEKFGMGEPTDEMVNAILKSLEGTSFRRIIAVGGGTIIDIAKVLAVAGPGEQMDDLYEKMPELTKHHELIIVPTTCGTGSEVTNIAVVSRVSRGVKQGLVSPAMYAEEAALICGMLDTLPYKVFATSSIDAMIHAVESYLSPNGAPISRIFSEEALMIIVKRWVDALAAGGGDAWKAYAADFLRASNYAGIAFGYAGCAAVHALSYPIGSVHHVPHGQSNQLMFADVMRKYKEKTSEGRMNDLEELLAGILGCDKAGAMDRLYEVMDAVCAKDTLREHGVTEDELAVYSENVLKTQQRLLKNNYVELTYEDILDIYRKAF
ncbi:MAG: iron-containing alcohol dehydrogenase [Lachnospiraceae bacterium]|nr:iron-containing alcohol dehydrogenase [Lachnospiraceae bacterium]